jgi:hypothetical protein
VAAFQAASYGEAGGVGGAEGEGGALAAEEGAERGCATGLQGGTGSEGL